MKKLMPLGLVLVLAAPLRAMAQLPSPPANAQTLQEEVSALRSAYETRLKALEQRMQNAETAPASTPASPTAKANSFNPSISLILSGGYTSTSQDPATYKISGFALPKDGEAGPGTRGFGLGESELGLSANIDTWLRGVAHIALKPDDKISVEEAYVQTTSMGMGLTAKAGRFFSGIGYLNAQHAHNWDFVDNPLVYQALLGTQYGDDGVQLKWLAPSEQYIELGAELGRGRSFPGTDTARNGAGMVALTAHTGGDIGNSHNWRAGVSVLNARATDQSMKAINAAGTEVSNSFAGDTRVWILDGVWKWAPNGNATRTSFKLQGEYMQSTRDGTLAYDTEGANVTGDYRAVQTGWYVQGVVQFMPRWRLGLRTEQLDSGQPNYGVNAADMDRTATQPRKHSLMLDYSTSEFSRVRLQFAQDHARPDLVDKQIFLQYQMSLGAHGAHSY